MGYYISQMIGIRTGGVFSGKVDIDDMKSRIQRIILEMRETDDDPDLGGKDGDPSHCISKELEAHKGSYVVIAGVFNYWGFESASIFAKTISKEFGTEVMHMAWNEQNNEAQCQIYLDGNSLFEVQEHPLGNILRRIT